MKSNTKISWKVGDAGQKVWQVVTLAEGGNAYWTLRSFATRAEAREFKRDYGRNPNG